MTIDRSGDVVKPAIDIDAIKKRCEAATKGPLFLYRKGTLTKTADVLHDQALGGLVASFACDEDAELFIEARTDVRALLAALAAAEKAREEALEALSDLGKSVDTYCDVSERDTGGTAAESWYEAMKASMRAAHKIVSDAARAALSRATTGGGERYALRPPSPPKPPPPPPDVL